MWALFYLSAGGYERTIKKMLKLMAGKMTSLALSQLVSNFEMILSKQKNAGLELWDYIVQTEKYKAILPLNPGFIRDDLDWEECASFSYDFAAFFCPGLRRKINCLSLILVDSINGPDYILEESKKLAIPETNCTDEADFTS